MMLLPSRMKPMQKHSTVGTLMRRISCRFFAFQILMSFMEQVAKTSE